MSKGFVYHEHGAFIDVKLDGKRLSIKELANVAEKMRLELLRYGVNVAVEETLLAKINKAKEKEAGEVAE